MKKYLFVPISTPGCGKSTVFRTLKALFPQWAHIENDNCHGKREFYGLVRDSMSTSPVVLLDRNNHWRKQRTEIFEKLTDPGVEIVRLNYIVKPDSRIWDLTYLRIRERGDNHQTLKALTQMGKVASVMANFFLDFQPLEPLEIDSFDHSIDMELSENSSVTNVKRILQFMHEQEGLVIPAEEEIERAYQETLEYKLPEWLLTQDKDRELARIQKEKDLRAFRQEWHLKNPKMKWPTKKWGRFGEKREQYERKKLEEAKRRASAAKEEWN